MRYRFTGIYTNGRTSICMNGVTFEGRESSEVPADIEFRFAGSVEFAGVAETDSEPDVTPPKTKRGRPRKADFDNQDRAGG